MAIRNFTSHFSNHFWP